MENRSGRQQPGNRPGTGAGQQNAGSTPDGSAGNRGSMGAGSSASGTGSTGAPGTRGTGASTGTGSGTGSGMSGAGATSAGSGMSGAGTGATGSGMGAASGSTAGTGAGARSTSASSGTGSSGMGSSGASGTQRDTSGTDRNESGTRGAADKARQLATDARSKATEATRERLTTQKSRAAESLGIVASSLRDSGNRLQERHEDGVSRMFTSAADQIERFSSTLENRDVGEMMREAERFARRQPAAFLGGAFVLGLVAARFFKASERNMEDDDRDRTRGLYGSTGTYDREAYRGAGERGYVGDREVPATPVVDSPPDDASSRSTTTGPSPELGR